jgi:IPT/TIG domain
MRESRSHFWRYFGLFLFLADCGGLTFAQSQQAPALVIEGGTLIDGNGGTPIPDSEVVIQENKINTVIQDGKVVELGYHANYSSPFSNVASRKISVEGLPWAVDMKKASRGEEGGAQREANEGTIPDPADSPQPAIETMNPIIVTQGEPAMVTLTGFNFVRKSAVYFKDQPVPFRIVSTTGIQVTLDAEALREAGRFDLVVKNPQPMDPFYIRSMWGKGTSNVAHLIVNYKY